MRKRIWVQAVEKELANARQPQTRHFFFGTGSGAKMTAFSPNRISGFGRYGAGWRFRSVTRSSRRRNRSSVLEIANLIGNFTNLPMKRVTFGHRSAGPRAATAASPSDSSPQLFFSRFSPLFWPIRSFCTFLRLSSLARSQRATRRKECKMAAKVRPSRRMLPEPYCNHKRSGRCRRWTSA